MAHPADRLSRGEVLLYLIAGIVGIAIAATVGRNVSHAIMIALLLVFWLGLVRYLTSRPSAERNPSLRRAAYVLGVGLVLLVAMALMGVG